MRISFHSVLLLMSFLSLIARGESTQNNLKPQEDWPKPVEDSHHYGLFVADILEYRGGEAKTLNWDLNGWRGSDTNRIWIKSEGEKDTESSKNEEADFQLLYGRLISPYFDAQVGFKYEQRWNDEEEPSRASLALALQGLALYMFEIDSSVFINQDGGLSARLTASEDFLLTQKLISQIRFETNASSRKSEKFAEGAGINDVSLGLRFRYEIIKEFAPYVGINWTELFGERANYATVEGERKSETSFVLGLRAWY